MYRNLSRYLQRCLVSCGVFLILLTACGLASDESGGVFDDAGGRAAAPLPPDAAPPEQQVYRYLYFEPGGLDISMTVYQSHGSEFLFERLCMLDHNNQLIPGAAVRWDSSPDGRVWTFYLRPDAQWSDGRPVTAHDFEYTYRRLLDPDGGNVYAFFYYDLKGAKAYNQRENTDPGSIGVRAVDDLTFEIETEQPCAFLPYITSFSSSSPAPQWQVEKYGRRWTEVGNCVSNSAFQLETWKTGEHMSFGLNPYYRGPNKGYLRKIVRIFTSTVGAGTGLAPYENNEVDMIGLDAVFLEEVRENPALRQELWSFEPFTTVYLYFRTRQPPFDDVRVRRAFAHAIDKEAITDIILKKTKTPAYTMLPIHFPGYVGDKYKSIQRYDPALARRLLAEAGYPDGKGFPTEALWLAEARSNTPGSQAAQAIQQMLQDNLGITISLRNTETSAYRKAQYDWEMPLSIIGFNYDFPDPHSMLGIVWRSQPKGYSRHDWQNPSFDDLIDRAAGEMNSVKRMAMYDEAERLLAEDAGAVFLWHEKSYSLRKPWVKGVKQDQFGSYPFYKNNTSYSDIYIGKEAGTAQRKLDY
jgi:oligopeptide transport system substrate-binding protein